jgi:hypothetical protein
MSLSRWRECECVLELRRPLQPPAPAYPRRTVTLYFRCVRNCGGRVKRIPCRLTVVQGWLKQSVNSQFRFQFTEKSSENFLGIGCVVSGRRMSPLKFVSWFVVYYESMKWKIKIKPIYECRCDGRLQTKRFTLLSYTGLVVELEHLKIKTRLTDEKFVSVKGECEI